ncbi:hypothetical protein [Kitasatospora sp. HPMI-4]|uniref:hypothetical protein n=1 Tax=Kitasatospora sp. HPMI-4 TaxID=3448443 RepID=UPI003F1D7E95
MTTRHSDHDLYVILADDAASELAALDGYRSARLDLVVTTLEQFRRPADWERYAIDTGLFDHHAPSDQGPVRLPARRYVKRLT